MFEGLSVAMVTPFRAGEVDWPAVDRLIDHLLAGGVDGIVPSGTTGEGATLTEDERERLVRRCVEKAKGHAFVLPGTGTNNTRTTVALTKSAAEWGADGALVVTPFYNKPTQAGLVAHYEAVADASSLPIVMYNVPSRTAVSMNPDTIRALSKHPRIVAIKEACGSLDQVSEICRDTELTMLSGDDTLTLPMLSVGGHGVISVVGNVIPSAFQRMLQAFRSGKSEEARRIHLASFEFTKALFCETNPAPAKHALAKMGLIEEELRLPLVPVSDESATRIDHELARIALDLAPIREGV